METLQSLTVFHFILFTLHYTHSRAHFLKVELRSQIAEHFPRSWSLLKCVYTAVCVCEIVRLLWVFSALNISVCFYQDWSIDINRTLSRREKKKPEGVTLTGINQTGADQPVQPTKTSNRFASIFTIYTFKAQSSECAISPPPEGIPEEAPGMTCSFTTATVNML